MQLQFSILTWGAWSPEYQQAANWALWQKSQHSVTSNSQATPQLAHVPAMQRRRFSRLTKMMLDVAFQCQVNHQTRSIFASRHGELTRTIGLLEDIIAKHPLSPLGFSQSVHNTASGIYGILANNRSASTSISAGVQTLSQAMVEAFAQLHETASPVLLVFGDDPVPPVYDAFTQETELPLALGFQLAPATTKGMASLTLTSPDESHDNGPNLSYGMFLHAIATQQNINGLLANWHWCLRHD